MWKIFSIGVFFELGLSTLLVLVDQPSYGYFASLVSALFIFLVSAYSYREKKSTLVAIGAGIGYWSVASLITVLAGLMEKFFNENAVGLEIAGLLIGQVVLLPIAAILGYCGAHFLGKKLR